MRNELRVAVHGNKEDIALEGSLDQYVDQRNSADRRKLEKVNEGDNIDSFDIVEETGGTRDPGLPELIIWDIDRTLLDAGPATHDAFQAAMWSVSPDTTIPSGPGMTGRTDPSVAREALLANGVSPERVDELIPEVLRSLPVHFARLGDRFLADGRVLPGVRDLLGVLATLDVQQTVLTGNIKANALFKLELFELIDLLDTDLGAYGDDADRRDDLLPLVLAKARGLSRRSVDPARVWVIGDTPGDLACARAGGVRCLLVATGLYSTAELGRLEPDAVLVDLADYQRVLNVFRAAEMSKV